MSEDEFLKALIETYIRAAVREIGKTDLMPLLGYKGDYAFHRLLDTAVVSVEFPIEPPAVNLDEVDQ